jgi:hypothetical protein
MSGSKEFGRPTDVEGVIKALANMRVSASAYDHPDLEVIPDYNVGPDYETANEYERKLVPRIIF